MFSVFVIVYACKKYKQVEDEDTMNNYEDDTPRTKAKKIQELGNVSDMEMYKTFNCGIGMLVFIEKENSVQALEILNKFPLGAVVCGEVYLRDNDENQINF